MYNYIKVNELKTVANFFMFNIKINAIMINNLPLDLRRYLLDFITPARFTNSEVKACARVLSGLARKSAKFKPLCQERLQKLARIYYFINKYPKYNIKYEDPKSYWLVLPENYVEYPLRSPQLIDAFLTGCDLPFAWHSFETYTAEIEDDIKEIVKLMPQSLNCAIGSLRCRGGVSVLFAAAINSNIPVHMVKFLPDHGADPNMSVELNCHNVNILEDLGANISAERFAQVQKLFTACPHFVQP